MTAVLVEQGIAIPPKWKPDAKYLKPREPIYPWATMKVGESFFVALPKGRSFTSHISTMKRKPELGKFEMRRVTENGNAGVRIWRTK